MEWNEWNDGDADDPEATHNRDFEAWPPAPLPPHERTWRHPSELGATTVHIVTPTPQGISRKATVATVAVGVLLVAGAVRMMVPSADGRSSTSAVSSGLSLVTTAIEEVTTAPSEPRETVPAAEPGVTPAPTFTSLRATTTLVTHVTTGGPNPTATQLAEFTMLGTATPTYAVVLNTGRYLATSAAAVSGMDTVEVQMPSGQVAQAVVIHADGPIALLDLADSSATPAPHGEPPAAGEVVTVGSPDGDVQATVGEDNAEGYRQLTSDEPLHESGPVYADGVVVGICTRSHDIAWLVPMLLLDDLAAQQPETPPLTSTSTTAVTSSTSSSTTSTSTSAPPSSVTSTSTAPTSTKPPTTTTPPTTKPPTSAPSTSAVPATTG